jgi:ferrochelatase
LICPGFTSDCLETLEEIAQEAQHAFLSAGGKEFHYISCLNQQPSWIEALHTITLKHMAHWPLNGVDTKILKTSREQALSLGAQN